MSTSQTGLPERQTFAKGAVICREGESGTAAFLVQNGKVRISKTVAGRRITIGFAMPGQVFGEMALMDDGPRMATGIAEEDTVCLVLAKSGIRTLVDQAPPGLVTLLTSLLSTMRSMGEDLAAARAELKELRTK